MTPLTNRSVARREFTVTRYNGTRFSVIAAVHGTTRRVRTGHASVHARTSVHGISRSLSRFPSLSASLSRLFPLVPSRERVSAPPRQFAPRSSRRSLNELALLERDGRGEGSLRDSNSTSGESRTKRRRARAPPRRVFFVSVFRSALSVSSPRFSRTPVSSVVLNQGCATTLSQAPRELSSGLGREREIVARGKSRSPCRQRGNCVQSSTPRCECSFIKRGFHSAQRARVFLHAQSSTLSPLDNSCRDDNLG